MSPTGQRGARNGRSGRRAKGAGDARGAPLAPTALAVPTAPDANPRCAALEDWFARRGWRPFEFQRETWRAYLAGESGLVHAPTGFGKSYAVWGGPLLEALNAPEPDTPAASPALRVLWITPLRALAGDTTAALRELVAGLGLSWTVELRTGDTPTAVRRKQRAAPPTALVTTPESLALLLSYAETQAQFSDLRCVIVDEWHELLSSKRGVQTELSLARLRRWRPGLRTWGLSATLGNLTEALEVLLGAPGAGRLVCGALPKRIELETLTPPNVARFPWAGHLGVQLVEAVAERIAAARSTLLFTNTRSQAEIWFQALLQARPDWLGELALHHGSLDRTLRSTIEERLRTGRLRCAVCTSSLDLGVDFSPVDQVLQVGSPKGVARMIQRAGRSGHAPGAVSRALGVPTHALELIEFAAAREAIAEQQLEAREPLSRPLDVLAQHVVTVATGGGFVPDELAAEVRSTHAYRELRDDEWQWVLDFARRGGPALQAYPQYARIRAEGGRLVVASPEIARLHRLTIGTIISDSAMRVAYVRGRALGQIEESFIARLRPGDVFVFGGRVLEFIRTRQMTAYVRPARVARGLVPRWGGARMPLSTQLSAVIRRKLAEARRGRFIGAEMRAVGPLLDVQARWSRLPAEDELLIEHTTTRAGCHAFLFALEGRLVHEGLAALLGRRLTRRTACTIALTATDWGIELQTPDALELDEAAWRALLAPDHLLDDLLAALNTSELARRAFREIARVAGLIFPGYPGQPQATRQLQASSALFFDVFSEFDPGNLLLDQARREVLERELDFRRLRGALERISRQRLLIVPTAQLSPLAFPLWAESLRPQHVSSETWSQRVQRMVLQLEAAAESRPEPGCGVFPRSRIRRKGFI